MTLVAIHQPNFFPWLGYFDKIRQADYFVFLDEVDYPRSGSGGMGSWSNRVKIDVNGSSHWLTAPVKRMSLGEPISAARIEDSKPWRKKALKTLANSYGRNENYTKGMALLSPLILRETDQLGDYNIANVKAVSKFLGLTTKFVRQSELSVSGSATELLVNIIQNVGGSAYLSGGGADDYQRPELFKAAGVDLIMQNYTPLSYGISNKFLPGLSVIDYLMRDGQKLEKP